ncbi:tabersonine 16-hydroxylase 2-like [Oryza glaberrima]|uniref:tabersonine 16-hydroxylase 2-like n=1 Tax=Oryza glaberrima TaxID=4538 RepID=UPI00224C4705|nr:tabersonine 16-hydroxylase 2-like [Oryza glaberrima]
MIYISKYFLESIFDDDVACTQDIFSAGSETSATTLAWAMAELIRNPTVLVNAWAIGHDERYWPGGSPEEFRPERFEDGEATAAVDFRGTDFEFLPFGAGRRMCPGMAFGLANVELPLASLLFHFDWEVPGLADPAKLDMTEAFGITPSPPMPPCMY